MDVDVIVVGAGMAGLAGMSFAAGLVMKKVISRAASSLACELSAIDRNIEGFR